MKCQTCGEKMKSKIRDYEYVESGLKNVVLGNITVHECKNCGEVLPEIPNVRQVHKWIAEYLVRKTGPLTGEEFRFLRKNMDIPAKELAHVLDVNAVTVSRWENNAEKVGPQSDRLFRALYVSRLIEALVKQPRRKSELEQVRGLLSYVIERLQIVIAKPAERKRRPEPIYISRSLLVQEKHAD